MDRLLPNAIIETFVKKLYRKYLIWEKHEEKIPNIKADAFYSFFTTWEKPCPFNKNFDEFCVKGNWCIKGKKVDLVSYKFEECKMYCVHRFLVAVNKK